MKLSERYTRLAKDAKDYAAQVANPRTISKEADTLNGTALLQQIKTARDLGYRVELRETGNQIQVYLVAKVPPTPLTVAYSLRTSFSPQRFLSL